jgi:TPP-dependent indolepyruvate ferredoxin oxidoreductase alpha subunit
MMSQSSVPADVSTATVTGPRRRDTTGDFEVAFCGQCSGCQRYFPCEAISLLQLQQNGVYQDTSRLICFECQRGMNPNAYQARELSRNEIAAALRQWLARYQGVPLPQQA